MADEFNTMKTGRGVQPVVNNPRLGLMSDEPPRPKAIKGKILLMADKPKADSGKQKRMTPIKKAAAARQPRVRPDQEEPAAKRPTTRRSDGYVRLRLRIQDGEVSVVGAKAVEGPLVESKLQGALVYEVMLGDERLAAGAIPDAGEQRSFPDPTGAPGQEGHYVTPLRSYEVNVRVPKAEVPVSALPKLEIALYRVKEELPVERAAPGPIGQQFERELREIGRIKGISADELDKPLAEEVRTAFK